MANNMLNLKGTSRNTAQLWKETSSKNVTPPLQIEFSEGDLVRVSSDENKMKELQNCKDCGGYSPLRMKGILGTVVRVKHISQYCVKVDWGNCEFDLHPKLIEPFGPKSKPPYHTNEIRDRHAEVLFEAIESGDNKLVCENLKIYLLSTVNNFGRTPVNAACVAGHKDIADFLIELETGMDIHDNNGNLPVHNCVISNRLDILELILKRHENQLHALNRNGQTLLHLSINHNNEIITDYLTQHGINVDVTDNAGYTALQYKDNTTNPTSNGPFSQSMPFVTMSIPSGSVINQSMTSIVPNEVSCQRGTRSRSASADTKRNYYETYMTECFKSNREPYGTIVPPSIPPFPSIPSITTTVTEDKVKPNECEICCNKVKAVAFVGCGHTSCLECANRLFNCHICKKEIIRKQIIFL